MEQENSREVVRFLHGEGIDALVVGGAAMEAQGVGSTNDVDLLLTVTGFGSALSRLADHPRVRRFVSVGNSIGGGMLVTPGGLVRFDLLNGSRYSGNRSGDALFAYLKQRYSFRSPAGPTLRPEAVWYLRLVPGSETALTKILRDFREKTPSPGWRSTVLRIAARFGTRAKVAHELRRLDELGRIAGVRTGDSNPEYIPR